MSARRFHRPGRLLAVNDGFTLIELLVVVGIIAILVAMLLPSLQRARQQAQLIQCQSNLKQVFLGFAMYANEFKDRIPPTGSCATGSSATNTGGGWFRYIGRRGYWGKPEVNPNSAPYHGDKWKILRCPSEYALPKLAPEGTYYDYRYVGTSYVMNFYVSEYFTDVGALIAPGVPTNDVFRLGLFKGPDRGPPPLPKNHADATLIMDIDDIGASTMQLMFLDVDYPPAWDYTSGHTGYYYAFRHVGKTANFLFMDGHVEARKHVIHGGAPNHRMIWSYPDHPPYKANRG